MMMLFPIVLSLAIIQWILTKIIVRPGSEFGEDKLRYTAGSKAYFTLQILTAIVCVVLCYIFLNQYKPIIGVLTFLFIIRLYFEKRYIAQSKRHIVTLWMISIIVAFTAIMLVLHENNMFQYS